MPSPRWSGAAPRGARERRKHVTRRDLLVAGRKLFGEQGLYESRIEDLSRQAGIAKGTLYGYFASKQELIEAVVSSGLSELLGQTHREAQEARTHSEVVARIAAAHLTFFEENPDLMRIFHQVRGLLKFRRVEGRRLERILAKYLTGLAQILALHRGEGQDDARANAETAALLFGAVSGIASTRAALAGASPSEGRSRATIRGLVGLVLAFEGPTGEVAAKNAEGARGGEADES
jgi:AcrR family transcriptional regulator